jgi:hypothetical protein
MSPRHVVECLCAEEYPADTKLTDPLDRAPLLSTGTADQASRRWTAASKWTSCELSTVPNQTAMLAPWSSGAAAVSSSNQTPPSAR